VLTAAGGGGRRPPRAVPATVRVGSARGRGLQQCHRRIPRTPPPAWRPAPRAPILRACVRQGCFGLAARASALRPVPRRVHRRCDQCCGRCVRCSRCREQACTGNIALLHLPK
jgi:hypothetical protein